MGTKSSDERLAENQATFRSHNERIQRSMKRLKQMAKEDGQDLLIDDNDTPLHFFCECADENCLERIEVKPSRYESIHKNRKRFIVKPGHEAEQVERVVKLEDGYAIVEKISIVPPEKPEKLNITSVENN